MGKKAKPTAKPILRKNKPDLFAVYAVRMFYKTKVFVPQIVLLYPKPSKLLLSGIIAGYKVKMSKRTSRTKETWNNYAYLEFGVDFVLNRP